MLYNVSFWEYTVFSDENLFKRHVSLEDIYVSRSSGTLLSTEDHLLSVSQPTLGGPRHPALRPLGMAFLMVLGCPGLTNLESSSDPTSLLVN